LRELALRKSIGLTLPLWGGARASALRSKKRGWLLLATSLALVGCEPELVVGKWSCPAEADNAGEDGKAAAESPVTAPWATGFEDGFCGYSTALGFCYERAGGSYELVTSPVHSGRSAAAFSISTGDLAGAQTRCVRRGTLPRAAYYSAYFYVPSAPSAAVNWNLMHFRGGDAEPYHGLWDVSLAPQRGGSLRVVVYDFLRGMERSTSGVPAVPIGAWFQLEVFWQRSADARGELAVYQDGQLALELTRLVTDDTTFGEWYVGNLALSLMPRDSTIYVDDVAIREAP